MERKAMGKVIHEAQPFGFVRDHNMMGSGMNGVPTRNVPRGTNEVENRGISVQISDADKNPGAYAKACQHRDNPFAWVGLPEKRSSNNYDPRMHISEAPI